jgi:hypothetical protein
MFRTEGKDTVASQAIEPETAGRWNQSVKRRRLHFEIEVRSKSAGKMSLVSSVDNGLQYLLNEFSLQREKRGERGLGERKRRNEICLSITATSLAGEEKTSILSLHYSVFRARVSESAMLESDWKVGKQQEETTRFMSPSSRR